MWGCLWDIEILNEIISLSVTWLWRRRRGVLVVSARWVTTLGSQSSHSLTLCLKSHRMRLVFLSFVLINNGFSWLPTQWHNNDITVHSSYFFKYLKYLLWMFIVCCQHAVILQIYLFKCVTSLRWCCNVLQFSIVIIAYENQEVSPQQNTDYWDLIKMKAFTVYIYQNCIGLYIVLSLLLVPALLNINIELQLWSFCLQIVVVVVVGWLYIT